MVSIHGPDGYHHIGIGELCVSLFMTLDRTDNFFIDSIDVKTSLHALGSSQAYSSCVNGWFRGLIRGNCGVWDSMHPYTSWWVKMLHLSRLKRQWTHVNSNFYSAGLHSVRCHVPYLSCTSETSLVARHMGISGMFLSRLMYFGQLAETITFDRLLLMHISYFLLFSMLPIVHVTSTLDWYMTLYEMVACLFLYASRYYHGSGSLVLRSHPQSSHRHSFVRNHTHQPRRLAALHVFSRASSSSWDWGCLCRAFEARWPSEWT